MAEETNQLRVRLVTPERIFFDHAAAAVELPAKNGYFEVLYGHAPLMAELGAGDVIVHGSGDSPSSGPDSVLRYNVSWGFAEVLGDRVTILASDALKPEEIDVPRANEQLERGNKLWSEAGDSEDAYTNALRVIHEAEAKIASAAEKP
ncbi:MAG: ATP synthase F1 subunit epsilon [Terracidiphilus sp.]|jgi:F-type H+-transporting ATPase subunit epsilon